MDFSEVLRSRVSVRAYLDKPVESDVLAAVLDDARHCPSWSNARGYLLALAQGGAFGASQRGLCGGVDPVVVG
ncbi:nitroreductase family protein [Trueperella pyogenes]|uniref:nitroreductase family protein n=1 Tax=Trueperella pyogenes TaxID=1661 RepID=UPI0038730908